MPAPLIFEGLFLGEDSDGSFALEVPAHRAVSLVGDEESGIDQLGRYALALSRPPGGCVLVYGQEIAELPREAMLAFRRKVGYLPPGDGLLQNLSLRDNVGLPLRFGSDLGDAEIDGRLQVVLAAARLTRVGHLRPAQASEEQRRRAAFARALAFDPELVILDHPFDGLTNRAAAELLELARGGESSEGSRRTVFMTGQDLPDILLPRIELRYRLVRGRPELEN
ncbi:MAG: ATP-binding cassette domain-containing protein [Gemmatimonadetes bacterium]|nr:ATP-binding cassette domain-containing protein [Gemmatimonadota bacterium]